MPSHQPLVYTGCLTRLSSQAYDHKVLQGGRTAATMPSVSQLLTIVPCISAGWLGVWHHSSVSKSLMEIAATDEEGESLKGENAALKQEITAKEEDGESLKGENGKYYSYRAGVRE